MELLEVEARPLEALEVEARPLEALEVEARPLEALEVSLVGGCQLRLLLDRTRVCHHLGPAD
jgi:hypothetical protein